MLYSIEVARVFWKESKKTSGKTKKLSKALQWQLIGEATIGAGTVLFTVSAHFGWLNDWDIFTQSSIRFVMFFATVATTWHLRRTMLHIKCGDYDS